MTEDELISKLIFKSSAPVKKTEYSYSGNEARNVPHYPGLNKSSGLFTRAKWKTKANTSLFCSLFVFVFVCSSKSLNTYSDYVYYKKKKTFKVPRSRQVVEKIPAQSRSRSEQL
jgi:hypothetical protein